MFSKTAQYSLRILIFMAKEDRTLFSAAYIHEQLDIPYKYLTMLMTKMSKSGLLNVVRGRNGGFTFERDAKDIVLIDVLDAIGENNYDKCLIRDCACNEEDSCMMHNNWLEPKAKLMEMLTNTSLDTFKL